MGRGEAVVRRARGDGCVRGEAVALVPRAWHHESARHLGGDRTTKGIFSVDERPRVDAATRVAEVAVLDDAYKRWCAPAGGDGRMGGRSLNR